MKAMVVRVHRIRIGLRRGLDAPPEIINHFPIAMLGGGRAPRAVWQFSFAEARRCQPGARGRRKPIHAMGVTREEATARGKRCKG